MVTFLDRLPETGALLALDVSRRRIGVAGSDPTQTLVTPLITIRRKRFVDDVAILARLCAEREVVALVVGLPLNMDGSIGPAAQSRRDVAARLMSDLALPVR